MKDEKSDGGFEYAVSAEAIREHLKLSPWDKLRWLRQASAFTSASDPARSRPDAFATIRA